MNLQEKKSENFMIRLSKSEKISLKDKALQANLSLSSYLIKAGLQQTIRKNNIAPLADRLIYAELGKIQQDVNLLLSEIDTIKKLKKSHIQHSLKTLSECLAEIQLQILNCCSQPLDDR